MQQAQVLNSVARGLDALAILDKAGITQPDVEIPQMAAFVNTAIRYRRAVAELNRARKAHANFAATHGDDDPAHSDYQARIQQARAVMVAQDEEYTAALKVLADARDLGPIL